VSVRGTLNELLRSRKRMIPRSNWHPMEDLSNEEERGVGEVGIGEKEKVRFRGGR